MKNLIPLLIFTILIAACSSTPIAPSRQTNSINFFKCLKELRYLFDIKIDLTPLPVISDTWGIEMELLKPDSLSQKDIAESLVEFFKSKNMNAVKLIKSNANQAGYTDYTITYKHNGVLQKWGVPHEPDMYDHMTKKVKGVEVTTSVMSSLEDEKLFTEVVSHLTNLGLTPARSIGGTHVHVGTNDLTVAQYLRLIKTLSKASKQLKEFFAPDRSRRHIEESSIFLSQKRLQQIHDQDMLLNSLESTETVFIQGIIRFNKNFDTIEMRIFNSSNTAKELLFNKNFAHAFIKKAINDAEFATKVESMSFEEILKELNIAPLY